MLCNVYFNSNFLNLICKKTFLLKIMKILFCDISLSIQIPKKKMQLRKWDYVQISSDILTD